MYAYIIYNYITSDKVLQSYINATITTDNIEYSNVSSTK